MESDTDYGKLFNSILILRGIINGIKNPPGVSFLKQTVCDYRILHYICDGSQTDDTFWWVM